MAAGFTLSMYPFVHIAKYQGEDRWSDELVEKPHATPAEEAAMPADALAELQAKRNSFPELPLVNYTTQYGMGCFEGLKAFPQPDGSLKLFRPGRNAARFARSMEGLMMPVFPEKLFTAAMQRTVAANARIGFAPSYDPAWEKTGFVDGHAVYIRPFTYSEPGIGLGLSASPWVVTVTTPVGSYFDPDGNAKAITTDRVRATPGGTGWIKCDANYVIPTLVKKAANRQGYMEAIFLDSQSGSYVEEGSSCNIFFRLEDDTLVTPALEDTVLPGINRMSVIQLAESMGVTVEERRITITEVLDRAVETFVTGTAAGVSYIESITHQGRTSVFNGGKMGELTTELLYTLKGIQYGAREDRFGWMEPVEV
ncbi:aminotransferase class IV [Spirochaeta africana]|uniref:Branched-chain-amino-acid aminotransferase n=1 Tax=Spirochaeta africana (strain ATCC 700263 / DSM 8902 / Z-7692) TaxID=889378 RepID=H9UGY3_SPIAZ|nr:aminotransferase class IV [Spirochaeta africana]AFG36776.1 branched-chain amino acid aminotransferase/4-amino-4-deoxychorismate lyase [Spirochaeta africana DSM 8902]